jgi:hypothetical protein
MDGLEELRVDLVTYGVANELASRGFLFGEFVKLAILCDRIFRFPISGPRVHNYDALSGQLLFAYLYNQNLLCWEDSQLWIDWKHLDRGFEELAGEIAALYKTSVPAPDLEWWIAAHDLISLYVRPSLTSRWTTREGRRVAQQTAGADPEKWVDQVEPDEFPLGQFYSYLTTLVRADSVQVED